MMGFKLKLLPLTLVVVLHMAHADEGPCDGEKRRQFDFWLGDWTVYSSDGKELGTNRLESILGGCGMQENWQSATGGTGTSYNFYVPARDIWHQTWVDASGGHLLLEGRFENGSMSLEGARPGSDGPEGEHIKVIDRITWTPLEDGSVRQHWVVSRDGGETWEDLFDGYYRKD